ncbi:putative carrier C19G12.05 [Fusarium oxysporum f. sp. albedinis]|nr:putative carrier C19G12.05 [Fusarium oxysporum f. sp. albedinis]
MSSPFLSETAETIHRFAPSPSYPSPPICATLCADKKHQELRPIITVEFINNNEYKRLVISKGQIYYMVIPLDQRWNPMADNN